MKTINKVDPKSYALIFMLILLVFYPILYLLQMILTVFTYESTYSLGVDISDILVAQLIRFPILLVITCLAGYIMNFFAVLMYNFFAGKFGGVKVYLTDAIMQPQYNNMPQQMNNNINNFNNIPNNNVANNGMVNNNNTPMNNNNLTPNNNQPINNN